MTVVPPKEETMVIILEWAWIFALSVHCGRPLGCLIWHYASLFFLYICFRYNDQNYSLAGCLNGGGQIKPEPGQTAKDLIQSLEVVYAQNVSDLVNLLLGSYSFEFLLMTR